MSATMKRVAEPTSVPAKKVRMDDGSFPESSPPANHFALGSLKYAVVAPFMGTFKIHVSQYTLDDESHLCRPTKVGVVMSPKVWEYFAEKVERFDIDEVLVCERELIVSAKSPQLNQFCQDQTIQLQWLFERGDGRHQIAPAFITLTNDEFQTLVNMRKQISQCYRVQFFGPLFRKLVLRAKTKAGDSATTPDVSPADLLSSLVLLFKDELEACTSQIFRCYGCKMGYENQLGHECMMFTPLERFDIHFERAIARINFKNFVNQRAQVNGSNRITPAFLSTINCEWMHDAVRSLYGEFS